MVNRQEKFLTKESAQALMKVKGEARGVCFRTDMEFVLKEKGKEGLEKLEQVLDGLGYPIVYEKMRDMNFYPIGQRVLSLLAIKEVFGFSDEKIKEMGRLAPKVSLVIKLFTKYFLSLASTASQTSRVWRKHYTVGRLTIEVFEKEKYVFFRLRDFVVHPILCIYLLGYFYTAAQLTIVSPSISAQETKCPFKGDNYHEFLIKWE